MVCASARESVGDFVIDQDALRHPSIPMSRTITMSRDTLALLAAGLSLRILRQNMCAGRNRLIGREPFLAM